MASEASSNSGKPSLVVETVQVSRGWKGAYQADYACPRCRSPLASKDDTLLGTDTCPTCKAAFIFGPDVQTAYRVHKADVERKEQEKRLAAEQRKLAAQQRGQASEAERQRLEEEEREYDERSKAERRAFEREREERVASKRRSLRGVQSGISALTWVSVIGSVFLIVTGFTAGASGDGMAATTLLVAGFTGFVSLLLVYGLFQSLFAIHQLLTDISGKLDRDLDGK